MNIKSLYSTPLNQISIFDIELFCEEKIPEGETLEYKEDLNNEKVVETIAAMANTDGGIILIGVPEEKIEGVKRGIPLKVTGFIPKGKSNVKQQISNLCRAKLQPTFIPEIEEYTYGNQPNMVLVLIRINKNLVPSFPVFHREQGIKIRVGEDVVHATPVHLKALFEANNSGDNNEIAADLRLNLPNSTELTWCTIGMVIQRKRFSKQKPLSTESIKLINNMVINHIVKNNHIWTDKYIPNGLKSDNNPGMIFPEFERTVNTLKFSPRLHYEIRRSDKYWYDISFNNSGLMIINIGISSGNNDNYSFGAEEITSAFHAMINLLSLHEFRSCFTDLFWECESQIIYRVKLSNLLLEDSIITLQNTRGIPRLGEYSGSENVGIEDIDPMHLAKHFTSLVLADAGYWEFEDSIEKLKLDDLY